MIKIIFSQIKIKRYYFQKYFTTDSIDFLISFYLCTCKKVSQLILDNLH